MQMVIHAVLLRQQSTAVACLFLNNLVGRRVAASSLKLERCELPGTGLSAAASGSADPRGVTIVRRQARTASAP